MLSIILNHIKYIINFNETLKLSSYQTTIFRCFSDIYSVLSVVAATKKTRAWPGLARPLFCLLCGFTAFRDQGDLFSNPAVIFNYLKRTKPPP